MKATGLTSTQLFLSDPDLKFSKSIGWAALDGYKSHTGRWAIVLDHGKVIYAQRERAKNVLEVSLVPNDPALSEIDPQLNLSGVQVSSAEAVLAAL
jgi:peroxiredoxin